MAKEFPMTFLGVGMDITHTIYNNDDDDDDDDDDKNSNYNNVIIVFVVVVVVTKICFILLFSQFQGPNYFVFGRNM